MMRSHALHRYWIKLVPPAPVGFTLGCGVTAFSEDDARQQIESRLRGSRAVVESVVADIDISMLDQRHVIPNIGDCTIRGIWFPAQ